MKRRLLPLVLALVMCLGLTVPALAADSSGSDISNIQITLPDGYEAGSSTDSYQIRSANAMALKDNSTGEVMKYLIARETEPSGYTIPTVRLPLGTTISVSDLRNNWSDGQVDVVTVVAYSDPDGDGVYDQWIYSFFNDPPVVPLETGSVAYDVGSNGKFSYEAYLTKDNGLSMDVNTLPSSVSLTTDYLNEVFGPDTLLVVGLYTWTAISVDPLTAFPTETTAVAAYYLTGEEVTASSSDTPAEPGAPAAPEVTATVDDWAKDQVNAAAASGLNAAGLGDNYTVSITRAQFAAVAVKLYEAMSGQAAPEAGDSPFSDSSDPAVIQAAALGIVGGNGDGTFSPDSQVTREDAATMLARVYTKLGGEIPEVDVTSFADDGAMNGYAKSSVAFMVDKKIINGVGDNKFDPQGKAAIQEALIIAARMLENLK